MTIVSCDFAQLGQIDMEKSTLTPKFYGQDTFFDASNPLAVGKFYSDPKFYNRSSQWEFA
jgi:hypothetical protein